jgi:hypothetical protein
MLRGPNVLASAFASSALITAGAWNFGSSNRRSPSGVRIITMSTRDAIEPVDRSTHSPSTGAWPSSSIPSSTRNALPRQGRRRRRPGDPSAESSRWFSFSLRDQSWPLVSLGRIR